MALRFTRFPDGSPENEDRVHIQIPERDQFALAAEYERVMKSYSQKQRADAMLMLELTRSLLEQTFYHYEEPAQGFPPLPAVQQVPIGDLAPGRHFSCMVQLLHDDHDSYLRGTVKRVLFSTVFVLMENGSELAFANTFLVNPQ